MRLYNAPCKNFIDLRCAIWLYNNNNVFSIIFSSQTSTFIQVKWSIPLNLNERCLRLGFPISRSTQRALHLIFCFLSTGRRVICNKVCCILGCVTSAKLSPRQKSIMKYELGIGVDTPARARQGYYPPAVMHLRNCEPRGKENAENISRITPRTLALRADFINEMLRGIAPRGCGNFRN